MPPVVPIALTIAGSDPSGGAGIQADLKTFTAFGVYGAAVITALTAQNTQGVQGVWPVPSEFVGQQIDSVLSDLTVGAIKTGMLANAAVIEAVVAGLGAHASVPLIVDPVMVATSGDALLAPDAVDALRTELLPRATLVTPNLPEAARLTNTREATSEPEIIDQARAIAALGCRAVLIKGGHANSPRAVDVLLVNGEASRFDAERIETEHTHGTGCTLSAAIAALLALGVDLPQAVRRAKAFVSRGLASGRIHVVGRGRGPPDHLYSIRGCKPPA